MNFEKKLKIRFITAFLLIAIGIILEVLGMYFDQSMLSSFGAMFIVIGVARVIQHRRITKTPESFEQRKIAETDERNVHIWKNARANAFSYSLIIAAVLVVLLYIFNKNDIGLLISQVISAEIVVYWICYYIEKKKN